MAWDSMDQGLARAMSWQAQPWLVGGNSIGSLASYLPRKLSRTCLAGTEWVTGHCNTLKGHPILT